MSKIVDLGKSLYRFFYFWVVTLAITLFIEQDKKIAKTRYFVWRRFRLAEQSGNPILVVRFIYSMWLTRFPISVKMNEVPQLRHLTLFIEFFVSS